jgi:hypothetical protein
MLMHIQSARNALVVGRGPRSRTEPRDGTHHTGRDPLSRTEPRDRPRRGEGRVGSGRRGIAEGSPEGTPPIPPNPNYGQGLPLDLGRTCCLPACACTPLTAVWAVLPADLVGAPGLASLPLAAERLQRLQARSAGLAALLASRDERRVLLAEPVFLRVGPLPVEPPGPVAQLPHVGPLSTHASCSRLWPLSAAMPARHCPTGRRERFQQQPLFPGMWCRWVWLLRGRAGARGVPREVCSLSLE